MTRRFERGPARPGVDDERWSRLRSARAMRIEGVGQARRALALDADAAASLEQQEVELGAVVRGPEVGVVGPARLQDFLDGVALPGRADLGVALEVAARCRCPRARAAGRCRGHRPWGP